MFDFYNTLEMPDTGVRLKERESFFVDLTVNFNEIQQGLLIELSNFLFSGLN